VETYLLAPARTADAARLALMAHEFIETGLRPTWDAARIARHIDHPDSVVLAARSDTAIVGFAIMRYADDSAHLNLLAVAPAHRRRGVARRLLTWLEETALTAGTFRIALELRAANSGARAFYAALGYRELECVPGYYQGREPAIRMARDVAQPRGGAAPPPAF
jgi:ribosomal-protein-alanine N-acetyltransferase